MGIERTKTGLPEKSNSVGVTPFETETEEAVLL